MFYNYIGGVILFGLIYNNGRKQSFQLPFRVRLDDVEGDILVLLSMALVIGTIVKGTIGFKDVMDAFAKGCYKACPVAFKQHASAQKTRFNFG